MIIHHKFEGNQGMFFVEQDDKLLAEMVYKTADPNKMIIEHTEVSEELRG